MTHENPNQFTSMSQGNTGITEAAVTVIYLSSVWIPAEDSVVFSTTQQEIRVSVTPGYGENSPVRKVTKKVHGLHSEG